MNKEAVGTLTGKYFHSVRSDRVTIDWQGQFLGLASPGLYRVQLFEWIHGDESEQRLVPATDMRYWLIYDTADQMKERYEKYERMMRCRRQKEATKDSPSSKPTADGEFGGAQ